MKFFGCFVGCLCLALVQSNKYDGFKVYKVESRARSTPLDNQWSLLAELAKNESYYELYSSRGAARQIMVHPAAQASFLKLLQQNALSYELIQRNLGQSLDQEFASNQQLRSLYPYNKRLGTERYHSHREINLYIEELARQHPARVFVKAVGRSYEGRWLKTITITNGDGRRNKQVILMDGGFHAREWISTAAVVYAIGELVDNAEQYADLLRDYDWVILPVANADGYEYSQVSADTRMWRKTRKPSSADCIGSDLNRNFDFHWNENGTSPYPCSDAYAGPKPYSEPEALVVRDLIDSNAQRGQMYLTLHSYGTFILYPWGWTSEEPATVADLHEVAAAGKAAIYAATGTDYTIGTSTNVIYAASGASDDYAFNAGFPLSFTMELPAGGGGFDPPAADIDRLVKETWVGIEAMARKVIQKYPLK